MITVRIKTHIIRFYVVLHVVEVFFIFFFLINCSKSVKTTIYSDKPEFGLFITTGSNEEMVFRSTDNIDKAISYAKSIKVDTIFIHVYKDDICYFDCDDRTGLNYKKASIQGDCDLLKYLLKKAESSGIKCFAWFNCFGFYRTHHLIQKYGAQVLTRDQYGRYFNGRVKHESNDRYYRRDKLFWLEPGDPRVQAYLLDLLSKLLERYPLIAGVQLDFIRYPADPPFIPGSRYMRWGYSSGYGQASVNRFYRKFGFYPDEENLGMEMNPGYSGAMKAFQWDSWRRNQITDFVVKSKKICRAYGKKLAASVFAFADRLYFHGFQDWRDWLKNKHVDFVILMNYSYNSELVYHITKQHVSSYPRGVWVALGAYIMKKQPEKLKRQLIDMHKLRVPGIVLFEYFSINTAEKIVSVIQDYEIR